MTSIMLDRCAADVLKDTLIALQQKDRHALVISFWVARHSGPGKATRFLPILI